MKKMKKLTGILGVTVIAVAMFFNSNAMNNSNGDLDLASLLEVNTANAECDRATLDSYCYWGNLCILICDGVTTYGFGWSNTP